MKLSNFLIGVALFVAAGASAQTYTSKATDALLMSRSAADVAYKGGDVVFTAKSVLPLTVSSDAQWATPVVDAVNGNLVHVSVTPNNSPAARTATITVDNGKCTRTLALSQQEDRSVEELPSDTRLEVSAWSSDPSTYYGSNSLNLAFDKNTGTFWHSSTAGEACTIEFTIKSGEGDADYFSYTTRSDGNTNGNWQAFSLYAMYGDLTEYIKIGDYNAGGESTVIRFAERMANPTKVKVVIQPGYANFCSASEIALYRDADIEGTGLDLFTDNMLIALKEGVTQEDVNRSTNIFYRMHAQRLLDGYDLKYRYGTYSALKSVQKLSEEWSAPGKLYDQIQGVTGINLVPGKHTIIVDGLPVGENVQLKVVAWWNGWESGNFDGCNPITKVFTLHNGMNVIDYQCKNTWTVNQGTPLEEQKSGNWPGLAYICYYRDDVDYTKSDEEQRAMHPDIKVHFVNAEQNGYLSLDKTNEEMHELTAKAPNRCMDVVGERVHQIWTAKGLHDYCRATDGSLGYLQFMNVIDSLIVWEHRSLGFEKYGRIPKNKSMAYVNFTYYMFQGGFGVSFHRNQEYRVLNCNTIINRDEDCIWGLSHEWGHQHQMNPYFCWSGMGEVSNNIQSYYNIMKLGYPAERFGDNMMLKTYENFVEKDIVPAPETILQEGHTNRGWAALSYNNPGEAISASKDYVSFCAAFAADTTIHAKSDNPALARCINEADVTTTLIPMLKLMTYWMSRNTGQLGVMPTRGKKYTDFPADWYEALRQNDVGSKVEKNDELRDKYELIAAAANGNKNGALQELKKRFPESTWSTHDYLNANNSNSNSLPYIMNWCRKCSRLVGYNLYPYFYAWGYFRDVALRIGDYGNRWYICTPEMRQEFEADMQQLVTDGMLMNMPSYMVEEISKQDHWLHDKPVIPNSHK